MTSGVAFLDTKDVRHLELHHRVYLLIVYCKFQSCLQYRRINSMDVKKEIIKENQRVTVSKQIQS